MYQLHSYQTASLSFKITYNHFNKKEQILGENLEQKRPILSKTNISWEADLSLSSWIPFPVHC